MKKIKKRMERLVVLPFASGCVSHSSVSIVERLPRRSKPQTFSPKGKEDVRSIKGADMKNTPRFLAVPMPNNISNGFQRLVKGFKGFSHLFVYEEEEMEEEEMEMEIGSPTDVKHVAHIGWDGSATTNPIKGWDPLISPDLFSLPSVPLKSLEPLSTTKKPIPLMVDE